MSKPKVTLETLLEAINGINTRLDRLENKFDNAFVNVDNGSVYELMGAYHISKRKGYDYEKKRNFTNFRDLLKYLFSGKDEQIEKFMVNIAKDYKKVNGFMKYVNNIYIKNTFGDIANHDQYFKNVTTSSNIVDIMNRLQITERKENLSNDQKSKILSVWCEENGFGVLYLYARHIFKTKKFDSRSISKLNLKSTFNVNNENTDRVLMPLYLNDLEMDVGGSISIVDGYKYTVVFGEIKLTKNRNIFFDLTSKKMDLNSWLYLKSIAQIVINAKVIAETIYRFHNYCKLQQPKINIEGIIYVPRSKDVTENSQNLNAIENMKKYVFGLFKQQPNTNINLKIESIR